MKKLYIAIVLFTFLTAVRPAEATVWNISNSGITFSPATITINLGDTVMFNLQSSHNVIEVSQTTWTANGSTSNGGFSLPFGGGMFVPTTVKTYYYVCQPHASSGMKGQIVVNNSTGIPTPDEVNQILSFMPNPAVNQTIVHTGMKNGVANSLEVFDLTGKAVLKAQNIPSNYLLDVSILRNGIYFVEFKSEGYRRTSKLVVSRN